MIASFDGTLTEDCMYAFSQSAGSISTSRSDTARVRTTSSRRRSRASPARFATRSRSIPETGLPTVKGAPSFRWRRRAPPNRPRRLRRREHPLRREGPRTKRPRPRRHERSVRRARCRRRTAAGCRAFRDAVKALEAAGLTDAIKEVTSGGRPYLGICFGLQLLFEEGTEHGLTPGLGQLAGRVTRFPNEADDEPLVILHIGWNEVTYSGDHPMAQALPDRDIYYFVHPYRPEPTDESIIVGRANYGGSFAAAVAKETSSRSSSTRRRASPPASASSTPIAPGWTRADGRLRTHPGDRPARRLRRSPRPGRLRPGDRLRCGSGERGQTLRRWNQAAPRSRPRRRQGRTADGRGAGWSHPLGGRRRPRPARR